MGLQRRGAGRFGDQPAEGNRGPRGNHRGKNKGAGAHRERPLEFQAFWTAEFQSGHWVDTNKLAQSQAALNTTHRAQLAEAGS